MKHRDSDAVAYKPLLFAGFALIALFAAIYGWSLHARDVGIRAVEIAQREVEGAQLVRPDTTTWSPQRIAAYNAALIEQHLPLALLRIPSVDIVVPVYEGTNDWALNRGVGRITGTAPIASAGNIGIAGHRDGFFRPLRKIRVGDTLMLDHASSSMRYRVVSLKIVEPADIGVLRATPTPLLTLVTCYPFYYIGPAPQRFIVQAARVDASEAADQTSSVEQRGQAHEQHAGGADQR